MTHAPFPNAGPGKQIPFSNSYQKAHGPPLRDEPYQRLKSSAAGIRMALRGDNLLKLLASSLPVSLFLTYTSSSSMKRFILASGLFGLGSLSASAAILLSGSTTVGLDTVTLATVGVTVTGAEGTGTSNITGFAGGLTSVPFAISPGETFTYDPATFPAGGSFAGSIEHTGTVSLSIDPDGAGGNPATALTVGEFSIRFDAVRATSGRSGFYVQDTFTDPSGPILFDLALLGAPAGGTAATGLTATNTELVLGPVNVLVSPELAGLLGNNSLTGADVGDARIDGLSIVPEPSATLLGLAGMGWLLQRRRRASAH
jgi:hypothetical protein